MDGVLVDNMKPHLDAFTEMARRYGVQLDTNDIVSMAGKGNDEIFARIFPQDIIEKVGSAALGEEKETVYRELYAPKIEPVGGLVAFFEELKSAGIKIAVGTSAIKANMDFVFDSLDIRRYFDAVVNADMVTKCKPDPEIYLLALQKLGLPANECLVFEDAVAGIRAAEAAGIKVVALSTTLGKATLEKTPGVVLTIKDFTEINANSIKSLVEPK